MTSHLREGSAPNFAQRNAVGMDVENSEQASLLDSLTSLSAAMRKEMKPPQAQKGIHVGGLGNAEQAEAYGRQSVTTWMRQTDLVQHAWA